MRVPLVLERENAGHRGLSVQEASNAVRLGFEMLRLAARCCGESFGRATGNSWPRCRTRLGKRSLGGTVGRSCA
jgi:hypothetical protein